MARSVQTSIRMTPKTTGFIDICREKSGVSRSTFIEDMVLMIEVLSRNPDKLEALVGPVLYEKYFKNSDR